MLSMMVTLYQKEKTKNRQLKLELKNLGAHEDETSGITDPSFERRTTVTFNFSPIDL
jgi:hypothetical protein